jgi:hypothetical protein
MPAMPSSGIAAPIEKVIFMHTLRIIALAAFLLIMAPVVHAQDAYITAGEAKNHVGEKTTVCGKVVGIHFVSSGKGQPTFIHFDEQYPNQIFTVVIWGADRPKFGRPEETYLDKDVCVTGKITIYLRIPEIVATNPNQIRLRK